MNRAFSASLLGDQTPGAFPQAEITCAVGTKHNSTRNAWLYQRLVVNANGGAVAEGAIQSSFASLQLD
jgi:hypothetical protein